MLAQVEGVGEAGRGALEFERPGEKKPRRSGARVLRATVQRGSTPLQTHNVDPGVSFPATPEGPGEVDRATPGPPHPQRSGGLNPVGAQKQAHGYLVPEGEPLGCGTSLAAGSEFQSPACG